MRNLEVLRSFEGLELFKQIDKLEKMLEKADFNAKEVVSNKGNTNIFYSKDGVDTVLVVIYCKRDNTVAYAVIDKDVYDNEFKGTDKVLMLKRRADNKYKIICSSGGWNNASLHHIVMGKVDGVQIDHITHNTFINTRECLRPCYAQENAFNKPFYSTVSEDGLSFRIRDKVIDIPQRQALADLGYRFSGKYIYSPKFGSEAELYAEIKRVETRYLMNYRYNPVIDYRDTWYAYVLYKMLGLVTKEELDAYVVGYFRRNPNKKMGIHTDDSKNVPTFADIVKYYQLKG